MIRKEYFNIKNPLDKIDPVKYNSKPRGYLTKQEFKQLIKYLQDKNDLRGLAYVLLSYSSGCRISEIRQLNRDSLDYDKLQFQVLGKGERYRTCVFSQEAGEAVKRYLETRTDDNPALFLSREHNRWGKESIERFLRKAAQEAGIKQRVFPHLLRHTRAMHLLEDGVSIYEIQKILGHSSIASTQIYAKMSLDQAQASVERFDNQNKWLE
jgi:integrase/recombinase XerD